METKKKADRPGANKAQCDWTEAHDDMSRDDAQQADIPESDIQNVQVNLPPPAQSPEGVPRDADNGWTEAMEGIVRSTRRDCIKYRWMHRETVKHYKQWVNILGVTLILLGSLSTLLSLWTNDITVQINKVISWTFTFFSVLNKFLNYPQLQVQHTVAGKKFMELFNSAQVMLLTRREDRAPAQTFIARLLESFAALEGAAPEIPKRIMEQLKAHPELISDLYSFDPRLEDVVVHDGAGVPASQDSSTNPFIRDNNVDSAQSAAQMDPGITSAYTRLQLARRAEMSGLATEMN
jgi:hypothetical protein